MNARISTGLRLTHSHAKTQRLIQRNRELRSAYFQMIGHLRQVIAERWLLLQQLDAGMSPNPYLTGGWVYAASLAEPNDQ
jgi:hypothetical protein